MCMPFVDATWPWVTLMMEEDYICAPKCTQRACKRAIQGCCYKLIGHSSGGRLDQGARLCSRLNHVVWSQQYLGRGERERRG